MILLNLIKNALKFTKQGFVEISCYAESNEFEICVKDTGIGIPEDKQRIIFEAFRQVEDTFCRNYGGVGIGLSVCKKLTDALGGRIWVDSKPENLIEGKVGGSTFYLTLPIKEVEKKSTNFISDTIKPKINYQNKYILIVEDDEPSYILLNYMLEAINCRTIWARNGIEAINLCKNNSEIVLVLIDIYLPHINGFEVAKAIKRIHPYMKIIAQTAYPQGKVLEDKNNIFNDLLSKPIDKNILWEKVTKYIGLASSIKN
jgi:CheY-like chemotaxis protein